MFKQKSYPDSGALFPNDSSTAGAPEMTGTLKLSSDLLKSCTKDENGLIVIRIAAWKKQGAKGSFFSVQASKPMAQRNKRKSGNEHQIRLPQ